MRWTPGGVSSDIEDRRGGGGFGGFGFRGAPMGCGGFVILLVLSLLFRRNLFSLLDTSGPRFLTEYCGVCAAAGWGIARPSARSAMPESKVRAKGRFIFSS